MKDWKVFKKKEIKADLRKKCGAEKCRERNRGREICNSSSNETDV
jgi:hypothetical protein